MLQGVPAYFQQHTMLWIHTGRFARRNAKELGIKQVYIFQETAVASVHLALGIGVWIIVSVNVPPRRRNFPHGIFTVVEQTPIAFRIMAVPWETAAHTDDGDWFVARSLQLVQAGANILQLEESILHFRQLATPAVHCNSLLRTASSANNTACASSSDKSSSSDSDVTLSGNGSPPKISE